jgi:predicted nucleic acid-binding protein
MATTAVDRVFVDTNVLVYANVASAALHATALAAFHNLRGAGAELWVSRQVLREYLATLTRPGIYAAPPSAALLATQVRGFESAFHVADETAAVTAHLLAVLAAFPVGGKQVHDANIVATMQAYGIARLLTHNVADFARFAPVITVEPLVP